MLDYKKKLFVLYDKTAGTARLGRVWKIKDGFALCYTTRTIDIKTNRHTDRHPLSEFSPIKVETLEALPAAAWIVDKYPQAYTVQVEFEAPNATQTQDSTSSVQEKE